MRTAEWRSLARTLFCILHSAFCILSAPAFAGSQVTATHAALATASPYATQIGVRVMQDGGNAADAAVAVGFALAVAKPQSGNIGGGGFLVYYDVATHGVWTLDFREMSPAAASAEKLPKPLPRAGAIAAAVPGTVAGLAALHERFGSRPWGALLGPAIALARNGIRVDLELLSALQLAKRERNLAPFGAETATLGSTLAQQDLAATLERIQVEGARDFYDGNTARRMVEEVRAAGGLLSLRDLREYKALWRAPIRIAFRGCDIYTTAPPSSGGLMIGEMLKILGSFDLAASGFQSSTSLHLIAEAERRAAIDRDKYVADPSVSRIPLRELLSDERAALWRASINPKRVTPTITLAEPGSAIAHGSHTTHFTIVDAQGNVASVTTTLGDDFGGGFVVQGCGFLLNDSMKDFASGGGSSNAPAGTKRMASSMAPVIVMRDGKPLMAIGTAGGPAIPSIVVNVLLNLLVYRQTLSAAIAAPRYDQQAVPEEISYEQTLAPKETIEKLTALGHGIRQTGAIGEVQAVMIDGGKLIAVSDPRHDGAAGGY